MAAGPWYTSSGIGDANIAVGERVIKAALNSSKKNNEILGHPVMQAMLAMDEGLGPLFGALGVSMGLLTHGTGKLSATAEGADTTPTNFSLSNTTTITPARQSFGRLISDWAVSVQQALMTGELSPTQYAMVVSEAYQLWANTLVDKVAAQASSLTNEIGLTGTALTWQAMHHGIIDFRNRGNRGRVLALIDNVGAKQLTDDSLSLGGAVQFSPQAQAAIQGAEEGAYLGELIKGADFYLCGELDDDGTDRFGMLLSPGAVQSKHKRVPLPREAILVADGMWFTVEALRLTGGESQFNTVSHLAVQIQEQARASMIRYKAS